MTAGSGGGAGWSGRILAGERDVAQPVGLLRAGRRVRFGDVGEAGAGLGRGLVKGGVAAAATGGGTHLRILGGGPYPGRRSRTQFAGATWSGGGAVIETASSHFEKVAFTVRDTAAPAQVERALKAGEAGRVLRHEHPEIDGRGAQVRDGDRDRQPGRSLEVADPERGQLVRCQA